MNEHEYKRVEYLLVNLCIRQTEVMYNCPYKLCIFIWVIYFYLAFLNLNFLNSKARTHLRGASKIKVKKVNKKKRLQLEG
jgi:hypothetical protein